MVFQKLGHILSLTPQNRKHMPTWLTKSLRTSCVTKRKLRISYYKIKSEKVKKHYRNYTKLLKKCITLAQKSKNNEYIKMYSYLEYH